MHLSLKEIFFIKFPLNIQNRDGDFAILGICVLTVMNYLKLSSLEITTLAFMEFQYSEFYLHE